MSTVKLRIGPKDAGLKMSMDEFWEAEEQPGYLYELARGVLEAVEVPGDKHGQVVDNLHETISLYRRRHPGKIRRIAHGSDVRLLIPELQSDRHPDLGVVFKDAPKNVGGRQVPKLVCEVVSAGARARRRDLQEKPEEYLTIGVEQYWITDPENREVVVLTRRDGPAGPRWDEQRFTGDDVITTTLFPDFQGRVSDLWIDAEAAADDDSPDGE